ncbi:MAG: alpha/beta fold hydrolase [Rhodobacteraceae bacterium]|nr:alpha/beta fold hydrolase [Paracoccaceae bacterium]
MSDLLLIHGSCHGAWCWDAVIPALAALGISAEAIDLPGRDGSPTTLDDYATAILRVAQPGTVLVGHSAGGYAITAAAEVAPDRFKGLIYLCAYLPAPGQSLADMRRAGPSQPLLPAIRMAADRGSFTIAQDMAPAVFYHDCPPDVARAATARLCPQPVLPQETPLYATAAQTLPRHYIICTDDRAIPPAYQAQMARNLPPQAVTSLNASHSPFLSMPDQLATRLAEILHQIGQTPPNGAST